MAVEVIQEIRQKKFLRNEHLFGHKYVLSLFFLSHDKHTVQGAEIYWLMK